MQAALPFSFSDRFANVYTPEGGAGLYLNRVLCDRHAPFFFQLGIDSLTSTHMKEQPSWVKFKYGAAESEATSNIYMMMHQFHSL